MCIDVVVLCPFTAPIYVPKVLRDLFVGILSSLRIISPRPDSIERRSYFLGLPLSRFNFPFNFITAPLISNAFLLAILAIGREEVAAGTIGADNIVPIDIMVFFVTLAYMAISLDATGLIRWLAYKVLAWGGKTGRRLFFFLYVFWFILTGCVGNDPTILSGTPFLAYITRVAKNIDSPRAWIFTQFAMANVASTILVSSNPTNLVLAGAFEIKFIEYTANVIVPVLFTAILLFPFLLFVVFRDDKLVPRTIDMHELPDELRSREPVNPNIPGVSDDGDHDADAEDDDAVRTSGEPKKLLLSLEEIMNPYLDKWSAALIAGLLATALLVVLALNAATANSGAHYPVFWVTLPAAVLALVFDMASGWARRHDSRAHARARRLRRGPGGAALRSDGSSSGGGGNSSSDEFESDSGDERRAGGPRPDAIRSAPRAVVRDGGEKQVDQEADHVTPAAPGGGSPARAAGRRTTVSSLVRDAWAWMRETFPNASHTLGFLPWALVPFAFAMFILVQALATKGWIPVFAYGWDHWVTRTGTVGAIGGSKSMFLVLLLEIKLAREKKQNTNSDSIHQWVFYLWCSATLVTTSLLSWKCHLLTIKPVRWHQHRHDHPTLPRHPGMAGHPRAKRRPHQQPHVLGDGIQHGARRQLRGLQLCLQRRAGRPALARHPHQEAHPHQQPRVCVGQPAHHRLHHGRRLQYPRWRGVYHAGDCSLQCITIIEDP